VELINIRPDTQNGQKTIWSLDNTFIDLGTLSLRRGPIPRLLGWRSSKLIIICCEDPILSYKIPLTIRESSREVEDVDPNIIMLMLCGSLFLVVVALPPPLFLLSLISFSCKFGLAFVSIIKTNN